MLVVIGNFVIGALAPITAFYKDDLALIDPVWRLVQGNQLGIDYHDPRGFGFFYLAALLWRWVGPHYYVVRAAADIFALVIVGCAFLVAVRQLRRSIVLSALFCVTVAVEASTPSLYGSTSDFGMALSYDRLIMAGLLVLFAQSFARGWDSQKERGYVDLFAAALLLNLLFLTKISGLVIGIAIIAAGEVVVRRPLSRRAIDMLVMIGFFAAMIVADFVVTGIRPSLVIADYRLAAQAQAGAHSFRDTMSFALQWRVLLVVALLTLYGLSAPGKATGLALMRSWVVIAVFWVCQIVLNMTNHGGSIALLYLAPGAVLAVVTLVDPPETANVRESWRRWIDPKMLNELSARTLLPFLILGVVLAHEGVASLSGIRLDHLVSSGSINPLRIAGHGGVVFDMLLKDPDDRRELEALTDGVRAIERLGLDHEVIANLDFTNPFPALFLSPPPKGGWAYWHFGNDLPQGFKLRGSEVIGDACIVAQPKRPTWGGQFQAPLLAAAKPLLETAFTPIYEDELWKIWRKTGGCAATAGAAGPSS